MSHALVTKFYHSEFVHSNIVQYDFAKVFHFFGFYFMIVSVPWKISLEW
jgi:hypothetical protein